MPAKIRKLISPLYVQLAIILSYSILSRHFFNFERPDWVLASALTLGVALHLLIGKLKYGKVRNIAVPLIIATGSTIQIYSPAAYPYFISVSLAILSKGFITYRGRHFLNPANFAIVAMLELFPTLVVGAPALFSGYYGISVLFLVLGIFTAFYARMADVALSWYVSFVGLNYLRGWLTQFSLFPLALQALNPMLIVFSFHMITDPMTTPATRGWRIAFGFSVALLDCVLRYLQVPNGQYYALFFVCCFLPAIWEWEKRPV